MLKGFKNDRNPRHEVCMAISILTWVTLAMFAGGFSELGNSGRYRFDWGLFPILSLVLTPTLGLLGVAIEKYREPEMKWGFIVLGCLAPIAALALALYGASDLIFR